MEGRYVDDYVADLEQRRAALATRVATFGPRSVPSDLRRDHVLTCATLAFVTDGFEGASMHAIAALAGVTKPVVYGLFGSKEELFAAVVDRANDELATHVEFAISGGEGSQLVPGVRAYLEYLAARSALWGQMFASIHHHVVAEAATRLRDRQMAIVADALGRGYAEAGLMADPRQVEALAHLVGGAVDSVGNWWMRRGDLPLDAIVEFLVAALAPALGAVRSEHAPVWPDDPEFAGAQPTSARAGAPANEP
ncbi:MAG TPA: TetR/AcrR family transcriptional regulator [Ilumatobacter sp.]|nr:TetR/AcrR family transcriptional regulator [Ilumatobacter sp.]